MAYEKPQQDLFKILRDDIPDELVKQLLQEQRDVGLFMRYSLQHWDKLKETHPNLSRYIAITSYQAAQDDPLMREKVAASLLGLCMLMDEAIAKRYAERLERAHGRSPITNPEPKKASADGNAGASGPPLGS